jgi:hypothetical protein
LTPGKFALRSASSELQPPNPDEKPQVLSGMQHPGSIHPRSAKLAQLGSGTPEPASGRAPPPPPASTAESKHMVD